MLAPRQPIAKRNARNEQAKERPRLAEPDEHGDERRDLECDRRNFEIHEACIGSWASGHEVFGQTHCTRTRPEGHNNPSHHRQPERRGEPNSHRTPRHSTQRLRGAARWLCGADGGGRTSVVATINRTTRPASRNRARAVTIQQRHFRD